MELRLLGLIKLKNAQKFVEYHEKVAPLIKSFGGAFAAQGVATPFYIDEIGNQQFDGVVEIVFPSEYDADNWLRSEELRSLRSLRQEAMELTLLRVTG